MTSKWDTYGDIRDSFGVPTVPGWGVRVFVGTTVDGTPVSGVQIEVDMNYRVDPDKIVGVLERIKANILAGKVDALMPMAEQARFERRPYDNAEDAGIPTRIADMIEAPEPTVANMPSETACIWCGNVIVPHPVVKWIHGDVINGRMRCPDMAHVASPA